MAISGSLISAAIGAFFKQFFAGLFKWLSEKLKLRAAKKEGRAEALVEVQNEDVRTIELARKAEQEHRDSVLRDPTRLRDDDGFRLPDKDSSV